MVYHLSTSSIRIPGIESISVEFCAREQSLAASYLLLQRINLTNSQQLDNDNCEIVLEFQRHYLEAFDLSAQSLISYAKRINETVIPHSLG